MAQLPKLTSLGIAILGALGSCSTTEPGESMGTIAPAINATLTDQDVLVLAPGDVLSVTFPRLPAWNQVDVIVQTDGRAAFLSLDNLRVAGMTLDTVDEMLTAKYTEILAQPELTVSVTTPAPRSVVVMGEVEGPGAIPLPAGKFTLLDALGTSGGFIRDTARLEHTMLARWVPAENRMRTWKIDASLDQWSSEPVFLQAQDVVFVPAQPVVHVNDWIDRYIRQNVNIFNSWFLLYNRGG